MRDGFSAGRCMVVSGVITVHFEFGFAFYWIRCVGYLVEL